MKICKLVSETYLYKSSPYAETIRGSTSEVNVCNYKCIDSDNDCAEKWKILLLFSVVYLIVYDYSLHVTSQHFYEVI